MFSFNEMGFVPVILFIAAVAIIIKGVLVFVERKRLRQTGIRVNGFLESISVKGDDLVVIEISFETLKNHKEYVSHNVYTPFNYTVGQPIAIIYDQSNPRKFMIEEGPYKPNGTSVIYAGIVLIMVAIIVYIAMLHSLALPTN